MPSGSGFDRCYIGLRAEDGAPAAIRYALPGRYAPEPPAGMEEYAWSGGFWVLTAPVEG